MHLGDVNDCRHQRLVDEASVDTCSRDYCRCCRHVRILRGSRSLPRLLGQLCKAKLRGNGRGLSASSDDPSFTWILSRAVGMG
jgi:hypothetical protein